MDPLLQPPGCRLLTELKDGDPIRSSLGLGSQLFRPGEHLSLIIHSVHCADIAPALGPSGRPSPIWLVAALEHAATGRFGHVDVLIFYFCLRSANWCQTCPCNALHHVSSFGDLGSSGGVFVSQTPQHRRTTSPKFTQQLSASTRSMPDVNF